MGVRWVSNSVRVSECVSISLYDNTHIQWVSDGCQIVTDGCQMPGVHASLAMKTYRICRFSPFWVLKVEQQVSGTPSSSHCCCFCKKQSPLHRSSICSSSTHAPQDSASRPSGGPSLVINASSRMRLLGIHPWNNRSNLHQIGVKSESDGCQN